MNCPRCHSRSTGQVGAGQYYCWDCFVEWTLAEDGQVRLFEVDEDGELRSVGADEEGGNLES